jgi:hypothetical protein
LCCLGDLWGEHFKVYEVINTMSFQSQTAKATEKAQEWIGQVELVGFNEWDFGVTRNVSSVGAGAPTCVSSAKDREVWSWSLDFSPTERALYIVDQALLFLPAQGQQDYLATWS